MTRRDSMILGLVTILASAFMFCYISGFNPTVVKWTVGVTIGCIALFFFVGYKQGLFQRPDNKK